MRATSWHGCEIINMKIKSSFEIAEEAKTAHPMISKKIRWVSLYDLKKELNDYFLIIREKRQEVPGLQILDYKFRELMEKLK